MVNSTQPLQLVDRFLVSVVLSGLLAHSVGWLGLGTLQIFKTIVDAANNKPVHNWIIKPKIWEVFIVCAILWPAIFFLTLWLGVSSSP